MPRQRKIIPIHLGLNKAADESAMQGSAAALHNCYLDIVGNSVVLNRRPGLKEFVDTGNAGSAIDGLFWWEDQRKMVVNVNGNVLTIDDATGNTTLLSGTHFTGGKRVTYADFKTAIHAADLGVIKSISPTAVTEMSDGDASQDVSHVAFLDTYLLANEIASGKCHFSDVGAPTSWSSNWITAESKYDKLQAIKVENLELYLFGSKTVEVWEDTGASDPFSRIPGGYIPNGTPSPYSVIYCGPPVNKFCFVDKNGGVVALSGRTTTDLSLALNRYLQKNGTVLANAAADFIKTQGHSYYVLHLPDQKETPVYDFTNGVFSHWSYWNTRTADFERWRGNCVAYAPEWGKVLVGDRGNGKVYELDERTYQDNGDSIRTLFRTDHMDREDVGAIKRTNFVDFRAKKPFPGGSGSIKLMIRHSDDGGTSWSTERTVTLTDQSGKNDYRARITRLGRYRVRQWEIYHTNNEPVSIFPPFEDYEITY